MDKNIIKILSFILPFTNEIANVLTTSKHPLFKNLYRPCIEPFLIDKRVKISKQNICNSKYLLNKMIIDMIAMTGIAMLIARNAIDNGFDDAVIIGFVIIFLSFVFPNMFLHKILDFFQKRLNIKSSYGIMIIGFIIIAILVFITYIMEKTITKYFHTNIYKKND